MPTPFSAILALDLTFRPAKFGRRAVTARRDTGKMQMGSKEVSDENNLDKIYKKMMREASNQQRKCCLQLRS
jgi:hypothetical protein